MMQREDLSESQHEQLGEHSLLGSENKLSEQLRLSVTERILEYLEEEYGIEVVNKRFEGFKVGRTDGPTFELDIDRLGDRAIFFLAHGFGHIAQRMCDPATPEVLVSDQREYTQEQAARLLAYEKQASEYGVQMLKDAGIWSEVKELYLDWSTAELAYMGRFVKQDYDTPSRALLPHTPAERTEFTAQVVPEFTAEVFAPEFYFWD